MKSINVVEPEKWFKFIINETQDYFIPYECEEGIVVDCGCNVGGFVHRYKNRFEKFICYDVLDENIQLFKNNLNGHESIYTIEKRACYDVEEIMVPIYANESLGKGLNYFGNSGDVSTFCNEVGWKSENKIDEVKSITLNEIVQNYQKITLLKCDIEGAEYKFLSNKNLKNIEYIVAELHFDKSYYQPLVDHIMKTHILLNNTSNTFSFKRKD